MQILLILGHPNRDSFNHAIARAAEQTLTKAGHTVHFHDLYAEGFEPLLPQDEIGREAPVDPLVNEHCEHLTSADGIIVVHPSWWGQPPAIVKGWIDRSFRAGVAYRFEATESGEGIPVGLLKAKKACVFTTANTSPRRDWGGVSDPLESMWDQTVLGFCGVEDTRHRMFAPVVTSDGAQREKWLEEVRALVSEVFAPQPAGVR